MLQCLEHRRCSEYVQRMINLSRDINYYRHARKRFLSTGVYFQGYFFKHMSRSYTIMKDVNEWVCCRCWQGLSLLPIIHHLVNMSFFLSLLHCGQVTATLEMQVAFAIGWVSSLWQCGLLPTASSPEALTGQREANSGQGWGKGYSAQASSLDLAAPSPGPKPRRKNTLY